MPKTRIKLKESCNFSHLTNHCFVWGHVPCSSIQGKMSVARGDGLQKYSLKLWWPNLSISCILLSANSNISRPYERDTRGTKRPGYKWCLIDKSLAISQRCMYFLEVRVPSTWRTNQQTDLSFKGLPRFTVICVKKAELHAAKLSLDHYSHTSVYSCVWL